MSPLSDDQRLTSLQLAVLRSLWERSEASVADVHADLSEERDLAPTTVATLMKRLEARGLLDHRSEGRQFIYRALVDADEVGRTMATDLVEDVYAGQVTG
ncbi:MAG: BlaI/MecI/CopY family transcriptional regulator, partial [Planctomycetota bacterium]